jgi:small-conductance mechanosensitive channel
MRVAWSKLPLVAVPAIALSATAYGLPEEFPSTPYVPAHFDWLQNLAERFANYIDVLSLEFSLILGPWSRQPIFSAITPAKILLLLIILVVGFGLAGLARLIILKYHTLGRPQPITERYWRNGILFALRKGLSGFFIFTGAFFASVPLLPHIGLALGGFPTFAIATKIAGIGYLTTALYFCFRIVRLVQFWLKGFVNRPGGRWYYGAFPVIGEALYYNLILCSFSTAIYFLQLPDPLQKVGYKIAAIAGIVANTILLIRTVTAIEAMVYSRAESAAYDAYKRRRVETRVLVLRRLLVLLFIILGTCAVLMNFQPVRQLGTGLLASAGVAGVIAGLAAQKSLSTIIAGLQIAITQPMRITDVVIVEAEWGVIEEITLTYVVVRIWDQRRLVVPITYFLEKPFQNWTRSSSDLIGTVFLYVDFLVPLAELREKTRQIVEASKLWDKRTFVVQVTEFKTDCVEIRILASAETAPELFDLRCEIRENLLAFLQDRHPKAFPRVRAAISRQPGQNRVDPGDDEFQER